VAGYAELDEIIGKMKRAAIDCWMADQGFDPVWGNEGTYAKWGWAPSVLPAGSRRLRRR